MGTFAAMYLLGYSLDNLSLMALTLSVGFVVDDAIVMLENVVRHMELGESPMEAALKGAKEIAFTIVSMTLSLVAVFIPVLFMGGIVGRLLHEFAVTISIAILVSGFVSISLTPMLCARWLRPGTHLRHGRAYMVIERFFEWGRRVLRLDAARDAQVQGRHARHLVLLLGVTAYLFVIIPKGFIPSVDTGNISATTDFAQGIGFDAMVAHQKQVADIVKADPNVLMFTSNVGMGGGGSSNQGRLQHRPEAARPERKLTADEVINELRRKVVGRPGRARVPAEPAGHPHRRPDDPQPVPVHAAGRTTRPRSTSPRRSSSRRCTRCPGLVDVSSDLQLANPQVNVSARSRPHCARWA